MKRKASKATRVRSGEALLFLIGLVLGIIIGMIYPPLCVVMIMFFVAFKSKEEPFFNGLAIGDFAGTAAFFIVALTYAGVF